MRQNPLSRLVFLTVTALPYLIAQSRVAIIGAGVGGAFTASRLAEIVGSEGSPELDVFEAAPTPGGRVQDLQYNGQALELGAAMFWEHNTLVREAALRLGLELREPGGGDDDRDGRSGLSVWDGRRLVLNMTGSWSDTIRAALRYGPAALRYGALVAGAFRRFRAVYGLQAAGSAWASPREMLEALGLYGLTQQRCSDFMEEWLIQPPWLFGGPAFCNEVAGAVNRCNYNQNNEHMNALACLVSFGPAAYGKTYQIVGGNRQLVTGLLAASGARLLLGHKVASVRHDNVTGQYWLHVRTSSTPEHSTAEAREGGLDPAVGGVGTTARDLRQAAGDEVDARWLDGADPEDRRLEDIQELGPYDAVVLATPLTGSDIRLNLSRSAVAPGAEALVAASLESPGQGAGAPGADGEEDGRGAAPRRSVPWTALQRPYQVTVTTYVEAGPLAAPFFGATAMPPVSAVLVTSDAAVPLTAVAGRPAPAANGSRPEGLFVYKVFSHAPLSLELLAALFEPQPQAPRVLDSRQWFAYPRFAPPERLDPFVLAPGLVYGNALEPAASAMELAALAGANSALLVARHLEGRGAGGR
ncbi:hypothetical protein HYH03_004149 [Edaphochlamys debaryana]|uniref:Prenylcysteine lyase domain-containing protein n=1 Tax=Edaphochlamys debaryana TaxID=47281 RepID=A0A835Y878_9CHLO|nr:hypothetical protein HYH03_004149 [Edaphochlamys debaryana]|eukprot:KAG2497883.1 hypothetical protein HYH03_004149 [Edaphochlamys debaryana]